jgi:hypothetical protein
MRTEQFKNASTQAACAIIELFQVQGFCGTFAITLHLAAIIHGIIAACRIDIMSEVLKSSFFSTCAAYAVRTNHICDLFSRYYIA